MAKSPSHRLGPSPNETIDRSEDIGFEFDGRAVQGFKGDTVASALAASGVTTFSRSFKYHRPRGLLCCSGNCPNCLVTVDGEPNVRACARAIRPGMKVEHQNAWPSLGLDVLSVLDRLHWLMPVGFYYKALHRPKALWRLARHVIRRIGGLGGIDITSQHEEGYRHLNAHADVAVVGGGPSGMAAALGAAGRGESVVLIDDQPGLGGHLRYCRQEIGNGPSARDLAEAVENHPSIRVMKEATAFGLYQDNLLGILEGETLVRLRASHVVLATGVAETPLLFDDNDRPGIMLASAAQRLVNLYGVRPGSTAVVATEGPQAYSAALDLLDAGIMVTAVIDSLPADPGNPQLRSLADRGVRLLHEHRLVRASGKARVKSVTIAHVSGGRGTRIACDLVCMSGGLQPSDALLGQAGGSPGRLPEGVSLTGRLAGALRERIVPPGPGPDARSFVCFCEDVTAHDIATAIQEGFEDIQTLKRYTTVSMGPCQGKMCGKRLTAICAASVGREPEQVGSTTDRPPLQPVPLAALAGPSHMPVKRTPVHQQHVEAGAMMVDAGGWQRPLHYGLPEDECAAVRERVGIIDVSTLGKLEVVGKDAGALLDRLYTHRFSDLPVGRIRYGLMCSDNGVIMDDGTVTRLGEDRYYVTTTSGNADVMEEWFNWWNAGSGRCAHVVNQTGGFAAINVAGPRARETLAKLTDVDLSPRAFRYMRSAQGRVAGVPALLLKIGFVGEAGWEIHFPAEHGEPVWTALMEAGSDFGISPFGLEAQRVLRLEKGHLIVGQDTDAVSNPLETGSEWTVRFDKPDFIGRGGLALANERGAAQKLVGFVMEDGAVPRDGVPVVSGGRPVGRVTSARRSPTLGRGFGLAWVPVELAREGGRIDVMVDDRPLAARVTLHAVYDPEGRKLRS